MPSNFYQFGTGGTRTTTDIAGVDTTDMTIVDLSATQAIDSTANALALAKLILPDPDKTFIGVKYSKESSGSVVTPGGVIPVTYKDVVGYGNGGSTTFKTRDITVPSRSIRNLTFRQYVSWYQIDEFGAWIFIGLEQAGTT